MDSDFLPDCVRDVVKMAEWDKARGKSRDRLSVFSPAWKDIARYARDVGNGFQLIDGRLFYRDMELVAKEKPKRTRRPKDSLWTMANG